MSALARFHMLWCGDYLIVSIYVHTRLLMIFRASATRHHSSIKINNVIFKDMFK